MAALTDPRAATTAIPQDVLEHQSSRPPRSAPHVGRAHPVGQVEWRSHRVADGGFHAPRAGLPPRRCEQGDLHGSPYCLAHFRRRCAGNRTGSTFRRLVAKTLATESADKFVQATRPFHTRQVTTCTVQVVRQAARLEERGVPHGIFNTTAPCVAASIS